uniref:Mitochondria-eating protein C-terminal domain-containing protein n=1 Tax=Magallana gigas TaxID=29159 RepID=K1QJX5_MAGGI
MADINNLILLMSKIQGELDETKRKLKQEEAEKERALTRLSSIAGAKLAHNNPGLTDLSDKYRPQKIGEHFSELYDNEWTEAVHQLTGGRDEEMAIQMIRDVLKFVANKTKCWADKQYKNLQEALFQRDLRDSEAGRFITTYKKISELQKEVAVLSISNAKKWLKEDEEFVSKYKDVLLHCEPFIDRSIEVCWMIQIQDPPMQSSKSTEVEPKESDETKLIEETKRRELKWHMCRLCLACKLTCIGWVILAYYVCVEKWFCKELENPRLRMKDDILKREQLHLEQRIEEEKVARQTAEARFEMEKTEKEKALTRLSAYAGEKLRLNNPGLADLSDENRPNKLAEKFSELYDNDWTDALESLADTNQTEESQTQELLHMLQVIFINQR